MSKLAKARVQLKKYNLTLHNIHEYCRICLTQLPAATKNCSYNFHTKPQLALLVKVFVSVDVDKQHNKFPDSICEQCYETVINYEQFRNVAQRSEATLQRVVQEEQNATTDCEDDQLLLPEILPVAMVKTELIEEETMLEATGTSPKKAALRWTNPMDEDRFNMDMNYLSSVLSKAYSGRFNTASTNETGTGLRRTFDCDQCDKKCFKLDYLEAHIRAVHEGYEEPFLCRKCTDSFKSYRELREHIRTSHPDVLVEEARLAEAELTCQLCQKKYKSKSTFDEHMKRHAQIKTHICKHCGVAKVSSSEIKTHLRTHETNIEKFKCPLCPQLFKYKHIISRHIRVVHEGERRFKCGYCNKSFSTNNAKNRHEMVHRNERPFTCDVCQKKYPLLDDLKSHMKSHDKNNWRFECRFCGKKCITRQSLLGHERRHEGEKPYICNVCSKGFAKNEDLEIHKRIHSTDVL